MKTIQLIITAAIFVFSSCKKDDSDSKGNDLPTVAKRELIYVLNSNLYSIDENGNNIKQLTHFNNIPINEPSYSRAANKVVFVSNMGDPASFPEIYTMNLDGTGLEQVTNNSIQEHNPAFSNEGTQIVYTTFTPIGGSNIYKINTDGSNQIGVTNFSDSSASVAYYPSWSPDDRKILFNGAIVTGSRTSLAGLFTIDTNGNNLTNIMNDSLGPGWSNYSPDGSQIIFDAFGTPPEIRDIYTINEDGSNLNNLTNFERIIPRSFDSRLATWSEDGQKIAFVTTKDFANDFSAQPSSYEIYVMDKDGSNQVRITNDSVSQWYPLWK